MTFRSRMGVLPLAKIYPGVFLLGAAGQRAREVSDTAESIVAKAREEAQCRVADAKARGRKQGFDEGLASGIAAGEKETREKLEDLRRQTQEQYRKLCAEYRERERQAKDGTPRQAFELAERILDIELHHDDRAFLGLVRTAAPHLEGARQAVLWTGPLGAEAAGRYRQEIRKLLGDIPDIEIRSSGDDDGRCEIETPDGRVDAGIRTQLWRAVQALGLSETDVWESVPENPAAGS